MAFLIAKVNGITPADAGKTKPTDGYILRKQDHPRGCGENVPIAMRTVLSLGSPPRMRGKQLVARGGLDRVRITPADAGKTKHKCRRANRRCGSPPRMRGKQFIRQHIAQDHPRGCGENTKKIL